MPSKGRGGLSVVVDTISRGGSSVDSALGVVVDGISMEHTTEHVKAKKNGKSFVARLIRGISFHRFFFMIYSSVNARKCAVCASVLPFSLAYASHAHSVTSLSLSLGESTHAAGGRRLEHVCVCVCV